MEIENLVVTLKVVNGEYIVKESKSEEKNLHIGHIENVLNYYGKKGWILKQINSDETELSFYRNKTHWFKGLIMGPTEIPELLVKVKFGVQAFTEVVLNATVGEGEIKNVLLMDAEQL